MRVFYIQNLILEKSSIHSLIFVWLITTIHLHRLVKLLLMRIKVLDRLIILIDRIAELVLASDISTS